MAHNYPPSYTTDPFPDSKSEATYVDSPKMSAPTPYQTELHELRGRTPLCQATRPRGYEEDPYRQWQYAAQAPLPPPSQSKKNRMYGALCCGSPFGILAWALIVIALLVAGAVVLVRVLKPEAQPGSVIPTSSSALPIASTSITTVTESAPTLSVSTVTTSAISTGTETTVSTVTQTPMRSEKETVSITFTPPSTPVQTTTLLTTSQTTMTLVSTVDNKAVTITSVSTATPAQTLQPTNIVINVPNHDDSDSADEPEDEAEDVEARESSDEDDTSHGSNTKIALPLSISYNPSYDAPLSHWYNASSAIASQITSLSDLNTATKLTPTKASQLSHLLSDGSSIASSISAVVSGLEQKCAGATTGDCAGNTAPLPTTTVEQGGGDAFPTTLEARMVMLTSVGTPGTLNYRTSRPTVLPASSLILPRADDDDNEDNDRNDRPWVGTCRFFFDKLDCVKHNTLCQFLSVSLGIAVGLVAFPMLWWIIVKYLWPRRTNAKRAALRAAKYPGRVWTGSPSVYSADSRD